MRLFVFSISYSQKYQFNFFLIKGCINSKKKKYKVIARIQLSQKQTSKLFTAIKELFTAIKG